MGGGGSPDLDRLTCCHGGHYAVMYETSDGAEALGVTAPPGQKTFRADIPSRTLDDAGAIHIGVPLIAGVAAEFRVRVHRPPAPDPA